MTDITNTFNTETPEASGTLSIRQIIERHPGPNPDYGSIEKTLKEHGHEAYLRATREKMDARGVPVGHGSGDIIKSVYSFSVEDFVKYMDNTPGSRIIEAVAQAQGESFMMGIKEAMFRDYKGF